MFLSRYLLYFSLCLSTLLASFPQQEYNQLLATEEVVKDLGEISTGVSCKVTKLGKIVLLRESDKQPYNVIRSVIPDEIWSNKTRIRDAVYHKNSQTIFIVLNNGCIFQHHFSPDLIPYNYALDTAFNDSWSICVHEDYLYVGTYGGKLYRVNLRGETAPELLVNVKQPIERIQLVQDNGNLWLGLFDRDSRFSMYPISA